MLEIDIDRKARIKKKEEIEKAEGYRDPVDLERYDKSRRELEAEFDKLNV
jgi:hypothetical protein